MKLHILDLSNRKFSLAKQRGAAPLQPPPKCLITSFFISLCEFYRKGMKLCISMPIKYKLYTQKEIILVQKKVHLLQDNEIKESSPMALKMLKPERSRASRRLRPLNPHQGLKRAPVPPVLACTTWSVGATFNILPPGATSTNYATMWNIIP